MTAVSLLERLAKQAGEEAEARLALARAEALRITQEGDEQRALRRRTAVAQRAGELRATHDEACAMAALHTANATLTARARLLDRVFSAANEMVRQASSLELLRPAIARRLGMALDHVDVSRCRVTCGVLAREIVQRVATDRGVPSAGVTIDEAAPLGSIVQSDDGVAEIDATVAGALRQGAPELSVIALAMFAEPR